MNAGKTVLVTGASGFVGRQCLAPLITQGYDVHATSLRGLPTHADVIWHRTDLLKREERERLIEDIKPDLLLHAAWYAKHGKFWQAPENRQWLEASEELFALAIRHGVKRIVGVGSCGEYDWSRSDTRLWKETDACRPLTPYGQAKLALMQALARVGISHAWARLFHMFGPYENPARLVPSIIGALLRGEPALCGSGTQVRDFMDVRDVGVALAALAASEAQGAVNVASGQPISIAAIAEFIGTILGRPKLIRLAARPDRPNEPPFMVADTTKLLNAIGCPDPPPREQRLAETVAFMRAQNCIST